MEPPSNCGICILAGGLSQRMGRDKARLQLATGTTLSQILLTAGELRLPLRVIRRDLVPRCGPLGGIYTALKTSQAEAELFLACDMPFVSPALLRKLLRHFQETRAPAFVSAKGMAGFPFLLLKNNLPTVEAHIREKTLSIQQLAGALKAGCLRVGRVRAEELFNVNTPEDWQRARQRWRTSKKAGKGQSKRTPKKNGCKSGL
jgi:molybdenum cofactor guanylyltransferase